MILGLGGGKEGASSLIDRALLLTRQRPRERAAAARALPGGAAVAMAGDGDRGTVERVVEEVAQVARRRAAALWEGEHLIEVAVVEVAAVIDADERAAHHLGGVLVAMGRA